METHPDWLLLPSPFQPLAERCLLSWPQIFVFRRGLTVKAASLLLVAYVILFVEQGCVAAREEQHSACQGLLQWERLQI